MLPLDNTYHLCEKHNDETPKNICKNLVNYRTVKSFVHRSGKMTCGQRRGFEYWDEYGLTTAKTEISFDEIFNRKAPIVVEIGFGMGNSLLEMAKNEPDKNFIGIEIHKPGVGSLLNSIKKAKIKNIRVYSEDANEVIKKCIKDNAVFRFQIYFPDPWHKTKHRKRRLIQVPFINMLQKKLESTGMLHIATDWKDYASHIIKVMSSVNDWKNLAGSSLYSPKPDYRPLTKFEKRGKDLGHNIWDLLFRKL